MKKHILLAFLILTLLLTACGADVESATLASTPTEKPSPTPAATSTPDPCSAENLPAEVTRIHKLTREFDDYSTLASNTPQSQLVLIIPDLQRILRDAEDQAVPACLRNLKKLQLLHMNIVVQTLLAFVNSSDVTDINNGIAKSRETHTQYDIELARLLGLTVVVPTSSTPDPQETLDPNTQTTPPSSGSSPFVTNPGPTTVNIRALPNLNSDTLGLMAVGASAIVLGRTADALWYQIEFPDQSGQTAWVNVAPVQISDPTVKLPVVELTP